MISRSSKVPAASFDRRLPAEAFYWGVLDPERLPRFPPWTSQATRRQASLYLFEDVLPVPVDQLHAAIVPATAIKPDESDTERSERRLLVCAMPHEMLQGFENSDVITLGPAKVPPQLGVETDAAAINLLHGPYQPRRLVTMKRTRGLVAAAAVIATAGAIMWGIEQRRTSADLQHRQLLAAIDATYHAVLTAEHADSLARDDALLMELRTLRRTRSDSAAKAATLAAGTPHAGQPIATILAAWPNELNTLTHTLTADERQISINAQLPDQEQAQRFQQALASVPFPHKAWRATPPRISTERDGVLVTLRFERETSP